MNIATNATRHTFNLVVEEGNARIQEDIATYRGKDALPLYEVPEDTIIQLLDAAWAAHEFNQIEEHFLRYVARLTYGDNWKAELEKAGGAE